MFFWFFNEVRSSKTPDIPWVIQDQTRVKHALLQKYIDPWMSILLSAQALYHKPEILVYVDSFAGPGIYYEDDTKTTTCSGSPLIVAQTANKYIEQKKSRKIYIICTESDERSASFLNKQLQSINQHSQKWTVLQGQFTDHVDRILSEFDSAKLSGFPIFFFIDPFGYSGYPMTILKRIMQNQRAELFINFMVYDINRFFREPQFENRMYELFGNYEFKQCDFNSNTEDTYTFLRNLYCKNLTDMAGAKYVMPFRVNKPGQGTRPRFFMIHASNNLKALKVMKDNMAKLSDCPYRFEAIGIDNSQISLFEDPDKISMIKQIENFIQSNNTITYDELEDWAYIHTNGVAKTIKEALLELESEDKITILRRPKQRKNTVTSGATICLSKSCFLSI